MEKNSFWVPASSKFSLSGTERRFQVTAYLIEFYERNLYRFRTDYFNFCQPQDHTETFRLYNKRIILFLIFQIYFNISGT